MPRQLPTVGAALLAIGLAHLALLPGFVIGNQRFGWDGTLGTLSPLFTWLVGSLFIAYTVWCYVRAALRPLGANIGPRHWSRLAVKGAVASLVTFALMASGLEPSLAVYIIVPLASTAVLAAWLAPRSSRLRGLTDLESHAAISHRHKSAVRRVAVRFCLSVATMLAVLVGGIGAWFFVPAWTPAIVDAQGNRVPGSIASLETVRLGGADQAILIRGWNTHNPVLLVLPGGPGGSYTVEGTRVWGQLEKYFTVVEWDPRGVAKSYGALTPTSKVTVQQIIADTIQLSQYLRDRFHQHKIYLLGHSGGSIYGIWAVKQRPDLYAAYIGGSQMVNNRLTDLSIYQKLVDYATRTGDQALLRMLRKQGPPPYWGPQVLLAHPLNFLRAGDGLALQYSNVINGGRVVFESPNVKASALYKQESAATDGWLMGPEYTLLDRINYFRGLNDGFTLLYPQMQSYDYRRDAPVLKVPVYFMLGQYDVNGTELSVDYFNQLHAPLKRLYIFQGAGHPEIFQQPEKFTDLMVNTVLPETRP